ncbi:unnamed protein product [Auanema sp. JU1783]|nr:unnamed protein product [Auanema sp. JU1783]
MTSEAGGLYQCLSDLVRVDDTGDYTKGLQVANKLLRRYPKEVYAYKCKVIALIQLGQYDDALTLIKKTPNHQMGEISFEKGYVLYRMGKIEEALSALSSKGEGDSRIQELQAQIYYKLERFQEAHDIYLNLLKNHTDDYDDERKANFIAVQAQLEAQGTSGNISTGLETYEHFYNAACHQIEKENWTSALEFLEKAISIASRDFEADGLSEEECEEELSIINVQKAFVLLKMEKIEEALELFKAVQATNPSDISVQAVLVNSIPCASNNVNLADARKKFKFALHLDQSKLSRKQRYTLMLNNAIILLLSNQREPCRRSLAELIEKFGKNKDSRLVEASLLVKLNEVDKAIEILDGDDEETMLAKIHILLNNGRVDDALQALRSLPANFKSKPGIASLIVSCLVALNKHDDAGKEMDKALQNTTDPLVRKTILDQAAQLKLSQGEAAQAVKYLEQLASISPEDVTIQCRLILAYADVDPKKAEALSVKVFPDDNAAGVNVEELEESDWILYGEKYRQKKETKMEVEDSEIITRKLKNRKRKRKIRLPKNYDPNTPPDPERWLPKQERAAYKKKYKKNRDRDIGRGTQGSSSANPNVEFTSNSPASPRPVGAPIAEGPRQMRPKQQKAKKKKAKY